MRKFFDILNNKIAAKDLLDNKQSPIQVMA